jgi:hypothetical protein
MAKLFRFIGKLPVPKDLRLLWQLKLLARSFERKMRKLRASNETDRHKLKLIESDYQVEISMINEERNELYTKQLIKQARRLRVQIPNRINDEGQPTFFLGARIYTWRMVFN